jgi:hypothetical protein
MAHSYHHAVSSARKFGGIPVDYQAVHDWIAVIWTRKPFMPLFGGPWSIGGDPRPCPAFLGRHVSQFGWSAVSPSRPAISQSAAHSGRQGKRAVARSHAQPPFAASMASTASTGP